MQVTATTRITIDATPTKVFEYLSDLRYHYLWNPQVQAISMLGKLKLGVTFTAESRVLGVTIRSTNTVTHFKPPRELTIENSFGLVCYTAKFHLAPLSGSMTTVKLNVTLESDTKGFTFTKAVLKQLALRELRTDLQALKVAVENKLE